MPEIPFTSLAHAALSKTSVEKLLRVHDSVVLERIAKGAGAINWYYCRDAEQLRLIESRFSPGSVVSFYFDDRIRNVPYTSGHKRQMEEIITRTGDVVIGLLRDDGYRIDVEFVDNIHRLGEATNAIAPMCPVFYGAFPDRDNDGLREKEKGQLGKRKRVREKEKGQLMRLSYPSRAFTFLAFSAHGASNSI